MAQNLARLRREFRSDRIDQCLGPTTNPPREKRLRKVLSNEGRRYLERPFAVAVRVELKRIKFDKSERFAPPDADPLGLHSNTLQGVVSLVKLTAKAVNERTYERFENPETHVVVHQQRSVNFGR